MTWVHWVLYNLPATNGELSEGAKALPAGTKEGVNDWKRTGYGGPCPPIGRHRYFFKLYALDIVLPDLKQPTKAKLEEAIKGPCHRRGTVDGNVSEGGVKFAYWPGRAVGYRLLVQAVPRSGPRIST